MTPGSHICRKRGHNTPGSPEYSSCCQHISTSSRSVPLGSDWAHINEKWAHIFCSRAHISSGRSHMCRNRVHIATYRGHIFKRWSHIRPLKSPYFSRQQQKITPVKKLTGVKFYFIMSFLFFPDGTIITLCDSLISHPIQSADFLPITSQRTFLHDLERLTRPYNVHIIFPSDQSIRPVLKMGFWFYLTF